jgi:BirA family biotin operon repressor/biotin-[acetyl-CoA-carboxylase] ligase
VAVFPAVGAGDDLSRETLERALGSGVNAVRYLAVCDSTNRVAMEWARAGAPEGCLVVADDQRAGRGRLDRRWFAPPGRCLLFSLVLRPGFPPDRLGLISLAAGVGLSVALGHEGLEARLKWPNDVLIAGRKVAGILCESDLLAGRTQAVILGVGVNVNVEREAFPEELRSTATSLCAEAGRRFDRPALLAAFLASFRRCYAGLGAPRPPVLDAYRGLCETLGRKVRIEGAERSFEAEAVDIDTGGGLVLHTGEVVQAGDVVHLRRPSDH